jgi:type IV pilus assembly protein PilM
MATTGLGVSVGSHSLRAVQVRRKGTSFAVTRAVSVRIEESMRAEAGRVLVAKGIARQPVTVGLSGRDVIIRYNQVPPVPEWRLKNLMKFEVMEVSGQSGGEVAADYRKLNLPDPDGTRGEETVLVALARSAYIDPLFASLDGAGLKVLAGCPNSVALFNAFAINATYGAEETCLLVNVGAHGTDLALERGGELIYARNATPGGKAFTDAVATAFSTSEAKAETLKTTKGDVTPRGQARYPDSTSEKVANAMVAAAGQLVALIQSTLMIGRAQTKLPDLKVDRVLLSGGGASLRGLDLYLKDRMGVPVQRFNPFEGMDTSALPEEERRALEAAPHEFAVALGLAQTGFEPREVPLAFPLRVLPESTRRRREFARRGVFAVAAAVVALAALPLLWWGRTAAADALAGQRKDLAKAESVSKQRDQDFRKQLVRLQEAREKHRRLAALATPGVLFADAVSVLAANLRERPEVWLEETTLEVGDPMRSYRLLHPASGQRGGFEPRDHSRSERAARVKVVGRVSPGQSPEKVFLDFVGALKANDRKLAVETRKTFNQRDGRFEIAFLRGVELKPVGTQAAPPWILREPQVTPDASGEVTEVTGLDVEGFPTTIRRDDVTPDSWKAMLESVPKTAPAGGNG